jgi:hypothetical protein
MNQSLHKGASLQGRIDCPILEIYENIKPDNEEVCPSKESTQKACSH